MENLSAPISKESLTVINTQKKEKKYTFLEVMVVLSAVTIVLVLGLLAINPGKKGAEARNLQRQADISLILNEVGNYAKTKSGIPKDIPITEECVIFGNEICKLGPYNCSDLVNLSFLQSMDGEKLVNIPSDPMYISVNGTGYYIYHNGEGLLTTCAPYAERNKEISFTKYLY